MNGWPNINNMLIYCRLMFHCFGRLSRKLTVTDFPIVCALVMSAGISQKACSENRSHLSNEDGVICRRLRGIVGDGEKENDVIFCGEAASAERNVVFFGGDVQDYTENMMSHRDNHQHNEWNLESTARIIQRRFPKSHVWVVKPTRMHLKTFSVYQNFVESNDFGAPSHNDDHGGFKHLTELLHNVISAASNPVRCDPSDTSFKNSGGIDKQYSNVDHKDSETIDKKCGNDESVGIGFDGVNEMPIDCSVEKPLVLVAFSKGCIVINQLLYELEKVHEDCRQEKILEQIHSMYWLDGGHAGGSMTWIVHQFVLKNLVGLDLEVFVHVTPYQIRDEMRAWIGKEERKFVDRLKKMGVKVTEVVHFDEEERSLSNHFKVLTSF